MRVRSNDLKPELNNFFKKADKSLPGGPGDVNCNETGYFKALDTLKEEIKDPNIVGAQSQVCTKAIGLSMGKATMSNP